MLSFLAYKVLIISTIVDSVADTYFVLSAYKVLIISTIVKSVER